MKKATLIIAILAFLFVGNDAFAQCASEVVCTTVGPPNWEYMFTGSGTGFKWAFIISGGCGVTDATAPTGWTAMPAADGATFGTFASSICGDDVPGFVIVAAGSINGTVFWQDPTNGTSGVCDGPVCLPATLTPTSSGSPYPTPTPTFTPSGPTVTPTLGPGQLWLVSAGPPVWTYRWYGTTDGFQIFTDCANPAVRPLGWNCIALGGGWTCANLLSPDPDPKWHEFFEFSEAFPPGALNDIITYNARPSGPPQSIQGPICAPTWTPTETVSFTPTATPSPTPTTPGVTHTPTLDISNTPTPRFSNTPTATVSTTLPISSGSSQIAMFLLLSMVAVILIFKAIKG